MEKKASMGKSLLVIERDGIIANLSECVALLRKCTSAEDAKRAMDVGVAAKIWAERQKVGLEAQNSATEFVLHAKRRLGQILSETEKHQGGRPGAKLVDVKRQVLTLKDLGISRDLSSQAQQLASVPEKQFEAAIAKAKQQGKEISQARIVKQLTRPSFSEIKKQPAAENVQGPVIEIDAEFAEVWDPEEIIATIYTFIDGQLRSASEEVRVRVGQALQEYASQLMEQRVVK